MTGSDDRVNIKVPPTVHEELNSDRDMSWPDYLLHLKRAADQDAVDEADIRLWVREAVRETIREETR